MKKLVGYISVVTLLFSLICFFPIVLHFIFLFRDRDLLINHEKYSNKLVVIDSLEYTNMDGSNADRVDGYSKELNNYKTMILFGNIRNDDDIRMDGMDDSGVLRRFVWYRQGIDFAYPANKYEKKFPIKNYVYDRLKFPLLWFLSIFLTIFLHKKYKQLKKIENEKNN
jgi:hypothetical protein